jgi:hypothetical protein
MDCRANFPLKPRRLSIVAVALFVIVLASQPGFSENNAPVEPVETRIAPASASANYQPFSKIAVGVTFGMLGAGVEVATPLSRRSNLRVDGTFFNYSPTFDQDGISYAGNIRLRDVRASYDFFPFHGGFRVSGGAMLYNQFNVAATAMASAGKNITLNSVDYYSDPSGINPLSGNATVAYANKVAPTFTIGWGNAIPRSGRHFAFPVEIGAAYTGAPKFNLSMNPNSVVCTTQTYSVATCGQVATFDGFQPNLAAERTKITNDIAPFRFYPILNAGVTYRF